MQRCVHIGAYGAPARQRRDGPSVLPVPHALDLEELLPLRPNLRLVKGAYLEPAATAYPRKEDVDAAYSASSNACFPQPATRGRYA